MDVAAARGQSAESLEKSVNRGYITGYYPEPVRHANDPTKIESTEVLEFAYSDPAYYRLLAKHGYPVSFAMNDFNDGTNVDKKWHDQITVKVDEIRKQLRDEGVMQDGDNDFKRELAKRIYDYVLSFFPRNIKDCKPERVDWDALENKCGFCSEASSILYFAYRYADLKPVFLESFESEPLLKNYMDYGSFPRYAGGHVFVGTLLSENDVIEADIGRRRFGGHNSFARRISERRFAGAYLINLEADITAGRGGSNISGAIFDILPDDQRSALGVVASEVKTMTPIQLVSRISWFLDLFNASPRRDYHVTEMQYLYALAQKQQSSPDILNAIREFVKADPRGSCVDAHLLVAGSLGNLENTKANAATDDERNKIDANIAKAKRILGDIVESSVRGNPNFLPMTNLLEQVEMERHTPEERIELYRDLIRSYPQNNIFRYLFANECTNFISAAVTQRQDGGNIDSIRDETLRHLKALIKSEPDQPPLHYQLSRLALYTRDDATALTAGKRGLELSGDEWIAGPSFLGYLVLVGIHSGDSDFLNLVLQKLQKDWPGESSQRLREIIGNEWGGYYTSADGRPLPRSELDLRINLVRKVMMALAEAGESSPSMDFMRWRQGGALALAFGAPVDTAKTFFDEIENKSSEEMQKKFEACLAAADKKIGDVDGRMFEANSPNMGLDRVKLIESYLTQERKTLAIPTYLKFASWAFDCGREDVSCEALEAAIRIDPEKAAGDFFNDAFDKRFEAIETGDSSNKENARRSLHGLISMLDPLWNNAGLLQDDGVHRLDEAYARLAEKLNALGDVEQARFCIQRSDHLRTICPR